MDWSVTIAYNHDGYGCGIEVKSMNEENQGMHGIELFENTNLGQGRFTASSQNQNPSMYSYVPKRKQIYCKRTLMKYEIYILNRLYVPHARHVCMEALRGVGFSAAALWNAVFELFDVVT